VKLEPLEPTVAGYKAEESEGRGQGADKKANVRGRNNVSIMEKVRKFTGPGVENSAGQCVVGAQGSGGVLREVQPADGNIQGDEGNNFEQKFQKYLLSV